MENILTVSNLTKKFGYLTAVKDLSFTIKKGNVYGILGPNGSGKSTTLGIVLNVVNRTQGEFSWFNGNISTHNACTHHVDTSGLESAFFPESFEDLCQVKYVP